MEKRTNTIRILEFFKYLLKDRNNLDLVTKAKKFIRSTDYYKGQFNLISRKITPSLIFLYCLKLCYDLGLDRNYNFLKEIQSMIFSSSIPINPLYDLGGWIYSSGLEYFMHDIPKDAVFFSDDVIMRILEFIDKRFDLIKEQNSSMFGNFIGKNIHFFISETKQMNNWNFYKLLEETGKDFLEKLKELSSVYEDPKMLADSINIMKDPFSRGFGFGIGEQFIKIEKRKKQIFIKHFSNILKTNLELTKRFGEGLSIELLFSSDTNYRKIIWNEILELANGDEDISRELLTGVIFKLVDEINNLTTTDLLNMKILLKDDSLSAILALNFSERINTFPKHLKHYVFGLLKQNKPFARIFGYCIREKFSSLDTQIQLQLIKMAQYNKELSAGLGF
jgi:hypothetical protein